MHGSHDYDEFQCHLTFYHYNESPQEQGHSQDLARGSVYGVWGHAPLKILKSRVSEMPFPAFWGKILNNSEGLKK